MKITPRQLEIGAGILLGLAFVVQFKAVLSLRKGLKYQDMIDQAKEYIIEAQMNIIAAETGDKPEEVQARLYRKSEELMVKANQLLESVPDRKKK